MTTNPIPIGDKYRFTLDHDRVQVVRTSGAPFVPDQVAVDGGEPMDSAEAVRLALAILVAAGQDDAAAAAADALDSMAAA